MSEHAIKEYLKTLGSGGGGVSQETDPVFTASPAHGISSQDITDWNNKSDFSGDYNDLTNKPTIPSTPSDIGAQEELVSGTNIKTINGNSVLGSGDLQVGGSGTPTPTANEVAEFDSSAHMNSTDMTSSQVDDFVDGLNVSGYDIVEEIPITVSRNTGSGGTIKAYKCGRIVKIEISSATNSSSISAGSNMYQATVTGLPNLHVVSGVTFYGSCCIIFQVDSYNGTGTLTGRVISSSLPANSLLSTSIVSFSV